MENTGGGPKAPENNPFYVFLSFCWMVPLFAYEQLEIRVELFII